MVQSLPVVLVCIAFLAGGSWSEEAEDTLTSSQSFSPLTGSLMHISASINYLWGVGQGGKISVCNVPCTRNWRDINGLLSQLDADESEVWGVNPANNVYRRPVDGSGEWTRMDKQLKHVSSSGMGYIWGVDEDEAIYKCKKPCNGEWEHVEGHLRQIDGGNQYVYGVNRHEEIWYRKVDGSDKSWQQPNGNKAKYITATGDNKVYKIGLDDKVYRCDAPCSNGQWTKISDDTFAQIDGSVFLLVARNEADHPYYKDI